MKYFRFFLAVFFEIVPKFSDFVNSDDCIGNITPKSIRLQSVFFLNIDVNKKKKIPVKK